MARTLPTIVAPADVVSYLGGVSDNAEMGRLEFVWRGVEAQIRRHCGQNLIQPADAYIDILPARDRFVVSDPLLESTNLDPVPTDVGRYVAAGPITDGHVLPLRQGLVRSITSVYVDLDSFAGTDSGDFASGDLLTSGSDYYLDVDEIDPSGLLISYTGFLIRKGSSWPTRRRTVKVTYVAGLTASELDQEFSDVRLAVVEEIVDKFRSSLNPDLARLKSETLGDWQRSWDTMPEASTHLSDRLLYALRPFVRYAL